MVYTIDIAATTVDKPRKTNTALLYEETISADWVIAPFKYSQPFQHGCQASRTDQKNYEEGQGAGTAVPIRQCSARRRPPTACKTYTG